MRANSSFETSAGSCRLRLSASSRQPPQPPPETTRLIRASSTSCMVMPPPLRRGTVSKIVSRFTRPSLAWYSDWLRALCRE